MCRNIALLLTVIFLAVPPVAVSQSTRLGDIHEDIQVEYSKVSHIDADEFGELSSAEIIVFDVREQKEYAVSHLNGAIQVSPGISATDFMMQFGDQLDGKTAVFYCSVGRRSSDLVNRLVSDPEIGEENTLFNLEGGMFSWVNERREIDGTGIHPYNWYWSFLIEDKSMIQYDTTKEIDE